MQFKKIDISLTNVITNNYIVGQNVKIVKILISD